jgi:uncharacterized protein (TIGR02246 family)
MKASFTFAALALAASVIPAAQAAPAASAPGQATDVPFGRFEQYQQREIEQVIRRYGKALDAGDVAGVMQLYSTDPVVLPPNTPTAVGRDAVQVFYLATFQAISLDITFPITEIRLLTPDLAFARSESSGTIRLVANGVQLPSANHELFILHKQSGEWKIARYGFSSTLP